MRCHSHYADRYRFDDLDWEWTFDEAQARYHTMDQLCDFETEHSESPMTLFLDHVVQWYESGGGMDTFLGCEMSPYAGSRNSVAYGRAGFVQPGSPLRTGWTTTRPTSLADYDPTRRTMVVQTATTNMLWLNYGLETHPAIFQMLLNIKQECRWYTKLPTGLRPVPFPKSYKNKLEGLSFDQLQTDWNDDEESQDDSGSDSESDTDSASQLFQRNMTNMGATCYLSGAVQIIMHFLPSLLRDKHLPLRLATGRLASDIANDSNLAIHKALIVALQDVLQTLKIDGGKFSAQFTQDVLRPLVRLVKQRNDRGEMASTFGNKHCDTAELMLQLINCLNIAGDHSSTLGSANTDDRPDRALARHQSQLVATGASHNVS